MRIEIAKPVARLLAAQKRIKMLVGGRGSMKSTGVADYVLAAMAQGQLWCCAREFQNTIEESVHRLLISEIERLGFDGFDSDKTHIYHTSNGRNFYRGLARNPTGLKSMLSGVDGLWIEEGETLSEETLRHMTASLRLSAIDAQKVMAGEKVKMPEIIITMNRGSRQDPVAQKWLHRADADLERCGYYEDDLIAVALVNYTDVPQKWFLASGLEQERQDDLNNMTRAEYDHKWGGAYLETIENAIIKPEWFDACVDAHIKLGFQALGQERVSYDCADTGDAKAVAYMHGSVIKDVQASTAGLIDTATDWACSFANSIKPDVFTWDADGMGMGLKRQIAQALEGKKVLIEPFRGSEGVDNPDMVYDRLETEVSKPKTNAAMFANKRAQYYFALRDRMLKTYLAIEKGRYTSPDELVSFSSDIEAISALKAELCRVPRKYVASGRVQLMTKAEMKAKNIPSPNMADAVMMLQRQPVQAKKKQLKPPRIQIA